MYVQSCFLNIYFFSKKTALVPLRDQSKNQFHKKSHRTNGKQVQSVQNIITTRMGIKQNRDNDVSMKLIF
jgi:hypothetical protein